MMLSLACDHRTVDGATGTFLANIETVYRKSCYDACIKQQLYVLYIKIPF
jgi:hypothetical protein